MATSSRVDVAEPRQDFVGDPELDSLVHSTLHKIRERLHTDQTSNRSSRLSNHSHASIRAKAEAARARIRFIDRETELKKQRALIQIDLETLQQQKDCAAAEAEANAYDDMLTLDHWERSTISAIDKTERTANYVAESNLWHQTQATGPMISTPKTLGFEQELNPPTHVLKPRVETTTEEMTVIKQEPNSNGLKLKSETAARATPTIERETNPRVIQHKPEITTSQTVRIKTEPYSPGPDQETKSGQDHNLHALDSVANYLMKKDLIVSRFPKFNDDPANFNNWRSSFLRIVNELKLTSQEQLDFLVNYLGPESSKFASNMRAISSGDPSRSLQLLWARLEERYGSPELIESTLKSKLVNFPSLSAKDCKKLYDLYDILLEIGCAMENPVYYSLLSYLNSSVGINPIVAKLPQHLQRKWVEKASRYKIENNAIFPPFTYFLSFVGEVCRISNDPSFSFDSISSSKSTGNLKGQVSAKKTGVQDQESSNVENVNITSVGENTLDCPIHLVSSHTLDECREFSKKTFDEKKQFLRDKKMCFKCCRTNTHLAKDCNFNVRCATCNSTKHPTALHMIPQNVPDHGGETNLKPNVNCTCTEVCGEGFIGRSCAKTLLVDVYPEGQPNKSVSVYAIIDDQSNSTLASPELLDSLGVNGKQISYELASCSGLYRSSGRKVHSLRVRARDKTFDTPLETVFECSNIPQNHSEIATSAIAMQFSHLTRIADFFPPCVGDVKIGLLIGRDVIEVHQVQEQIIGPRGSPFAQKLGLGWVIIGEVCLGKAHRPRNDDIRFSTFKTHMLGEDRASIFRPCHSNISIKAIESDNLSDFPFQKCKDDEKLGLSIDDREFLKIMDQNVVKEDGHWVAPLPFKDNRGHLPNNKVQALKRARNLDLSLKKSPQKMQDFLNFMEKIFKLGHAELAPNSRDCEENWYLPIFGVYHPKKPNQVRVVFDSSATYEGVSLNSVLLQGPDLTNSLLSILLRFRKDNIAIIADIEQMFYCFSVSENHRNFLKFFWHKDNDPEMPLVEYRMRKHVFGNSPSPAVATYCLRKSVQNSNEKVKSFVYNDFYVDDGLTSVASPQSAVRLLKETQRDLIESGLRLHKIASNHPEVMKSFGANDLAKNLVSVDFENQSVLPSQRSLGLEWDLSQDSFIFKSGISDKPNTKRGILSTINSIFDPIGFLSPVVLKGKLILREVVSCSKDWDEPISSDLESKWIRWKTSLQDLDQVKIPRCYVKGSLSELDNVELHVFSDASEKAISSVVFLAATDRTGSRQTGFVIGKSKVAPSHGHTIPRLELCAALLSVQLAEVVSESLHVQLGQFSFYTDSRVVLGYLNNKTRRFHNYVCNRVQKILSLSRPEQWRYVSTQSNPADHGTRGLNTCSEIMQKWLSPPKQLTLKHKPSEEEIFPLINPDQDKEIRVQVNKSVLSQTMVHRFDRFSIWNSLVRAFSLLIKLVRFYKKRSNPDAAKTCSEASILSLSENFLVKQEQAFMFPDEVACLKQGKPVPEKSKVACLNPYLDSEGLMRVGGRLKNSCLPFKEMNPVILDKQNHISKLLVKHAHEKVRHQGRLLTEGAIRQNGYWVVGAKRLVQSVIHHCVQCKKLRGKVENQLMADLPEDRLIPSPPFTYVGLDTFGPWQVVTRKTRGGVSNSKRWAILFTCLTTRAIHIEVIEEMSSSSFINSLRRFVSLRGSVKQFRSDRGTNFVGAVDSLGVDAINVEDGPMKSFLHNSGITWLFNPPHSSHMGGVWERMIGVTRKVLNGIIMETSSKELTHEVLVTFMAEACAIVNARPLVPVSTDPSEPFVLSPSVLINQKSNQSPVCCDNIDIRSMYKAQWKHVQVLSDMFWKRWRQQYIQNLQRRTKWSKERPSVKNGDVILLKDKELPRNDWSLGVVTNTIKNVKDGLVRKAEVAIMRNGKRVTFTRPITEMVLLVSD